MPFCFAPWSNIDISPQGNIGPCCKFQHAHYPDPPLNINRQDLVDYEQSNTVKIIRQDFQQGRWPLGCDRCRIEEEHGLESKRQLDHDRWKEHYQLYDTHQDGLLTASVAFGNTCNLTCITCGPHASSRWQSEHLQLLQQNIVPNHFYRQGFIDQLLSMSPNIIHLDVPGGEPFLSGVVQQHALLDRLVAQGRAKQISLHYTTNVTIWPDTSWWNLWQHFREVDMQLSLDGVGDHFEYIRYPASWDTVNNNIEKYLQAQSEKPNLKLSVSHTVSAYNIYYLPEFLNWCKKQGLPRPWLGRVHDPAHMRPSVWPSKVKQCITDKLRTGDEDALSWINLIDNTDDSENFSLFCERLSWHDRYRGLDFRKTFPEMAVFL